MPCTHARLVGRERSTASADSPMAITVRVASEVPRSLWGRCTCQGPAFCAAKTHVVGGGRS
jgi:hypothetical protein